MTQRFFRSDADTYEGMRVTLDAQFGHPSNIAKTVYEPLASAVQDEEGRCYLAVRSEFCEWPQVAAVLPSLLEASLVEEITREQYHAVASQSE